MIKLGKSLKKYEKIFILLWMLKRFLPIYIFSTVGVSARNFFITYINTYWAAEIISVVETEKMMFLTRSVAAYLGCIVVFCVFDAIFIFLHRMVIHKMIMEVRHIVYGHVINCHMYCLGTYGSRGDIVSRLNQDIGLVENMLNNITPMMYLFSGIGASISILTVRKGHWVLMSVFMYAIVIFAIQKRIANRISSSQKKLQKERGFLTSAFMESIDHVNDIKLCGHKNYVLSAFVEKIAKYSKSILEVGKLQALNSGLNLSVQFAQYIGFVFVGILLCSRKIFSIEDVIFMAPMVGLIVNMITSMGNIIQSVERNLVGVERVFLLINLEQEPQNERGIREINVQEQPIRVNNLEFSYRNCPPIFNGICFEVNTGEIVGIIGSSGVGKSTLTKILLGLYPYTGSCKLWGHEIVDYNLHFLRETIVYVPQNGVVMEGTIKENLVLGNRFDCSDNKMMDIISKVGANTWIEMQGGICGMLQEDGKNLSGGQKQSLAIIRALLRNAKLIVFDESFSALDHFAKHQIMLMLKENRKATVLIVTHDQEIIDLCDRCIEIMN